MYSILNVFGFIYILPCTTPMCFYYGKSNELLNFPSFCKVYNREYRNCVGHTDPKENP